MNSKEITLVKKKTNGRVMTLRLKGEAIEPHCLWLSFVDPPTTTPGGPEDSRAKGVSPSPLPIAV